MTFVGSVVNLLYYMGFNPSTFYPRPMLLHPSYYNVNARTIFLWIYKN